jgi:hypothetical protein
LSVNVVAGALTREEANAEEDTNDAPVESGDGTIGEAPKDGVSVDADADAVRERADPS